MSWIASVLVLSVIVIFHEFGHFLLARANGVAVVEFSLGFGPRLLSVVSKKSGTRYSVKCIPFGGSCAMLGELGEEEAEAERREMEAARQGAEASGVSGESFFAKSALARISIVAAGPIFNFVLAFLFSLIIISWAGYDPPVIVGVMEGYPAEAAGIQAGDVVTRIRGRSVGLARDITYVMYGNGGEPVSLSYKRYVEETGTWEHYDTVLVPKYSDEAGVYYLGVQWNGMWTTVKNPAELIRYGAYEVRTQVYLVVDSLRMLFAGKVGADDIAGPVRIVTMIDQSVKSTIQYGLVTVFMNLLNMSVMFSANLGVMNLLPFPALDGGRLVFLLWELATRRPVNARVENAVNMTGMALLMALMVFVILNDVRYLL